MDQSVVQIGKIACHGRFFCGALHADLEPIGRYVPSLDYDNGVEAGSERWGAPPVMKGSLDHPPERKRSETERVRKTLLEEFEAAMTAADGRRRERVYKIILFGNSVRGGWIEERGGLTAAIRLQTGSKPDRGEALSCGSQGRKTSVPGRASALVCQAATAG